jgi:hypothetical protein
MRSPKRELNFYLFSGRSRGVRSAAEKCQAFVTVEKPHRLVPEKFLDGAASDVVRGTDKINSQLTAR